MRSIFEGAFPRRRVALLCALTASIAACAAPAANAAGRPGTNHSTKTQKLPQILSAPKRVHGGRHAVITAHVKSGALCKLTVSTHRHRGSFAHSPVRHAVSGELEWVWSVPRNVRSGASFATVSCRHDSHRARRRIVAVRERGAKGHRRLAHHIRVVAIRATEAPTVGGLGGASYPPYGAVLVPGSDWFGGHGVNVYSNGYAGNDSGVYQCVDLVTRFVAAEHFGPTIWGNANQLYADAESAYYVDHPNGSGYIPVAGDIITLGGGAYGHVVIVDQRVGSTLYIVEQNASASGRSALTINLSTGYISGEYGLSVIGTIHAKANASPPGSTGTSAPPATTAPPTTTAPIYKAPSGSTPRAYTVQGTGSDGLFERTGAGTSYSHVSWLPNGGSVDIACQIKSSSEVGNSYVWDLLTDGYYVADYYMDTPTDGGYSPGIGQCVSTSSSGSSGGSSSSWVAPSGSTAKSYSVYGTGGDGLYERSGPGTSYGEKGLLPEGAKIEIACQVKTSSEVGNSYMWDLLTTGYFVADYYVNTPDDGSFSPGIAACVHP